MYTTPRKVKQESRLRRSLSLTNNSVQQNNTKGGGGGGTLLSGGSHQDVILEEEPQYHRHLSLIEECRDSNTYFQFLSTSSSVPDLIDHPTSSSSISHDEEEEDPVIVVTSSSSSGGGDPQGIPPDSPGIQQLQIHSTKFPIVKQVIVQHQQGQSHPPLKVVPVLSPEYIKKFKEQKVPRSKTLPWTGQEEQEQRRKAFTLDSQTAKEIQSQLKGLTRANSADLGKAIQEFNEEQARLMSNGTMNMNGYHPQSHHPPSQQQQQGPMMPMMNNGGYSYSSDTSSSAASHSTSASNTTDSSLDTVIMKWDNGTTNGGNHDHHLPNHHHQIREQQGYNNNRDSYQIQMQMQQQQQQHQQYNNNGGGGMSNGYPPPTMDSASRSHPLSQVPTGNQHHQPQQFPSDTMQMQQTQHNRGVDRGVTFSDQQSQSRGNAKLFPTKTSSACYNQIKDMISSRFGQQQQHKLAGNNGGEQVSNNNQSGSGGVGNANSYIDLTMGIPQYRSSGGSYYPGGGTHQHPPYRNGPTHPPPNGPTGPPSGPGLTVKPNQGSLSPSNGAVNTSFRKAIHQSTLKSNLQEDSPLHNNNANGSSNQQQLMDPGQQERAQRALDKLTMIMGGGGVPHPSSYRPHDHNRMVQQQRQQRQPPPPHPQSSSYPPGPVSASSTSSSSLQSPNNNNNQPNNNWGIPPPLPTSKQPESSPTSDNSSSGGGSLTQIGLPLIPSSLSSEQRENGDGSSATMETPLVGHGHHHGVKGESPQLQGNTGMKGQLGVVEQDSHHHGNNGGASSSGNDSEWVDLVEPEIQQILDIGGSKGKSAGSSGGGSSNPISSSSGQQWATSSVSGLGSTAGNNNNPTTGIHPQPPPSSSSNNNNPLKSQQGHIIKGQQITNSKQQQLLHFPHHQSSPKLPMKGGTGGMLSTNSGNKLTDLRNNKIITTAASSSSKIQGEPLSPNSNNNPTSSSKVALSLMKSPKIKRSNSGGGGQNRMLKQGVPKGLGELGKLKMSSGSNDPTAQTLNLKGGKITRNAMTKLGQLLQSLQLDETGSTTGLDFEGEGCTTEDGDGSEEEDGGGVTEEGDDLSTTIEATDAHAIRRQLQSLESMYTEVLKVLNEKKFSRNHRYPPPTGELRSSHKLRRPYGSMSSLPSSVSSRPFRERTSRRVLVDDKKNKVKDLKGINRRFQRLESHVVTLARSVAHLSSEMRTQHLMVQEMDSIRNELQQLRNQVVMSKGNNNTSNNAQHPSANFHRGASGRHGQAAAGMDWTSFRNALPSLTNPCRVRKLTQFFGDEPPLIRIFLKKLGYEKYAAAFEAERIGIMELPYLTEERLNKMGIPMGPRLRILQEAQMCFKPHHHHHPGDPGGGGGGGTNIGNGLSVYVV